MSRISERVSKTKGSQAKLSLSQPSRFTSGKVSIDERTYKVYMVNFHGNALQSIRDEFTERVKSGLRRKVFILDVDEEIEAAKATAPKTKQNLPITVHPMKILLAAVERCIIEYDRVTDIINKEETFDLIGYWFKYLNKRPTRRPTAKRNSLPNCPELIVQEHNRVGNPTSISKIKFIEDEPDMSKLFIIIVGDFDARFISEFLLHHQPLMGVIDFLPGECGYEMLLPHPETQKFLDNTLEDLQDLYYEMRKGIESKITGFFQQSLPVISRCLARKYSDLIYDQLCWCVYDVEMLYRHYLQFYVQRFNEINVALPRTVSIEDSFEVARSLSLQGRFLKQPLPGATFDMATIAMYLDGIMNTVEPYRSSKPKEFILMERTASTASIFDVVRSRAGNFASTVKIETFQRLLLEAPNRMLMQMVSYVEDRDFKNVYMACLEYNHVRKLAVSAYMHTCVPFIGYGNEKEPFLLPPYVQLFLTKDAVVQNLEKWALKFDTCDITEISPDYKLYHFVRNFNEIRETYQMTVVPTRLCFRDFTIFQMEEFLANLETPEQVFERKMAEEAASEFGGGSLWNPALRMSKIDEIIFIRPNSLKMRKLQEYSARLGSTASMPRESRPGDSTITQAPPLTANSPEIIDEAGLPPDHPLLFGYNLDDTRQEITVKTTTYNFEEGLVKLNEENWCFTNINTYLTLRINHCQLNLEQPRMVSSTLRRDLRLVVMKNVTVRVYNKPEECAKVVINYANGLSIFHHESYAEQEWYTQESYDNEQKRVFTPLGAVIVYSKNDDLIKVYRYNGEVYRLYQYEFVFAEEEEEGDVLLDELHDETSKIEQVDSTTETRKSKRKSEEDKSKRKSEEDKSEKGKGKSEKGEKKSEAESGKGEKKDEKGEKKERKSKRKSDKEGLPADDEKRDSKESLTSRSRVFIESAAAARKRRAEELKNLLIASVQDELRFLENITKIYNLGYLHLIVTTSTGREVNFTHKGKVYLGSAKVTREWHDYAANESYSLRGDGTRMIWTKDSLRCYHADGTLMVTKLEEYIETFNPYYEDDFISASSSHGVTEEQEPVEAEEVKHRETGISTKLQESRISAKLQESRISAKQRESGVPLKQQESGNPIKKAETAMTFDTFLHKGGDLGSEMEEEAPEDFTYVAFSCNSFQVQHASYAEVLITINTGLIIPISVAIYGIHDIIVEMHQEYEIEDMVQTLAHMSHMSHTGLETSFHGSHPASPQKSPKKLGYVPTTSMNVITPSFFSNFMSTNANEKSPYPKTLIKIWVGDDYYMCVGHHDCEVETVLSREENKNTVHGNIKLNFGFEGQIGSIYTSFIDAISTFKDYKYKKCKEIYFLEKYGTDCKRQGFRFFDEIPVRSEYQYHSSNTTIEFAEMQTNNEKMTNVYPQHAIDMNKFPRFKMPRRKNKKLPEDDIKMKFPLIAAVSFYCKIPQQLTFTEELDKFMQYIEHYNFKKLTNRFRDGLEYFLRPIIRIELAKLWSKHNWERKKLDHERRLFREEQRKSLYHLMLRHKVYPKYREFVDDNWGHVKNIEFFDFVRNRCEEKAKETKEKGTSDSTISGRNGKSESGSGSKMNVTQSTINAEQSRTNAETGNKVETVETETAQTVPETRKPGCRCVRNRPVTEPKKPCPCTKRPPKIIEVKN